MKETHTLTPSEDTADDEPDDEGPGSSSSPPDDPMPDSRDLGGSLAPDDRRGPPPPSPVNRSRSPRRRGTPGHLGHLCLFGGVIAAAFDLTRSSFKVPGCPVMLKHLVEPWPADWLDFQLDSFEFKEPTKCLLRQMIPWQDLLQRTPPATQPEIHLFMDGSWLEKKSVGGYAVVAAVAIPGMQAILGMWGERQWPPAYSGYYKDVPTSASAGRCSTTTAWRLVWRPWAPGAPSTSWAVGRMR